MMNRKGVSLVTVLMFMLVATIAATATFKWLTSEGASSADRMVINEARASAVAGVEAARAWMTYHGNETGAILKQFNDENRGVTGNKTPIRLDAVLAPMAKDGQSFTVSLVDVQASGTMATYEVKIISKGIARNGQAEYTEAAVFAVSGLYQVPTPKPDPVAPYHFAYFGGSTSFSGDHKVTSMVINGDWGLGKYQYGSNPGHIENDFIVTGKTVLSGNNIFVGGTGCFGGDLEVDNGLTGKEIYVAGNAVKNKYGQKFVTQLTGDAYFNGDVEIGSQAKPGFYIGGSVTLNGKLYTNLGAFDHTVDGDLCLGESAAIMFSENESDDRNLWTVSGNVHMPKSFLLEDKGIARARGTERYLNRIFGNKASSRVYIRDAFKCDGHYCNHNNMPSASTNTCNASELVACKTGIAYQVHKDGSTAKSYSTFTTKGTVEGKEYSNPPFQCAKAVRAYCDSVWHPVAKGEKACDGAKYKVSDLLVTAYDKFEKYALNGKTTGIAECNGLDRFSSQNTTKMNTCYTKLSSDKEKSKKFLYNGYAVFKLTSDENKSSEADNRGAPQLNGRFIFIYEAALAGNNPHFPQTTSDAHVFVYLKKGTASDNTKITCQDNLSYNYFVYTEANVGGLMGGCTWNGSFYARADSCAKIPEINGSSTLKYDADVVNDMYAAGIVCANDGTPCGGAVSSSSAASPNSSASDDDGEAAEYDSMYVATGDHLIISVESEYKSKEREPDSTVSIKPSMMIFPRVVYLNQDAVGKLSDYYSIIPLNGLAMTGSGNMTANSTLAPPTTGKLVPKKGQNLTKGIYSYTYTYTENGKVYKSDFYVVVAGKSSETPLVHFVGGAFNAFQQGAPNSADVDLAVSGVSGSGQFAVKVSISENLTGWTITNADGSAVQWQNAGDGTRYIVVTKNMTEDDIEHKLFKIRTTSDAVSGTLRLTLYSPENCILGGGPIVKTFNIKGTATIHRGSLVDYCAKYPEKCAENSDSLKMAMDYEECPDVTTEWVKVNCVGASTVQQNEEWTCDAGVGSANVVKLYKGSFDSKYCVLYIPEDNNYVDNPKDDHTNPGGYALYASLKRKAYRLKVDTEGIRGSSKVVVGVSESYDGTYTTVSPENCADGLCTYIIYAGQYFKATARQDGDRVSKWLCHTCADRTMKVVPGETFKHIMEGDHYITAVFNEKDEHCFYSEFDQSNIWCTSDVIECINYCDGPKQSCSVLEGYNNYKNPNWVAVNSKGGPDKKPSVSSAGGLYYAATVSGIVKKEYGDPVVLLNSVDGGTEGSFDVRVQTDVVSTVKKSSALLNSGIIVRSNNNASEYILVSVFGANITGSNVAVDAYARVCYVKDVVRKTNDNNCQLAMFKGKNLSISSLGFLSSTQLNFSVDVEGDSVIVSGTYVDGAHLYEVVAGFDLKNVVKQNAYTLNDEEHNRVGLKLSDAEFKVFDATWNSKKYINECFANPRIFCSFTAKYMDGQVPLNEEVTPSIGYSSWFANEGKGCMNNTEFYYNGCDLPANTLGSFFNNAAFCGSGVCSDGLVENYIGNNGFSVYDGDYVFRCEGAHGFQHATRNGFVRNASVEVNCNRINGKKYDADCGEFYVGEVHNCQQDEEILKIPMAGGAGTIVVQSLYGNVYNLRDAELVFDLTMEAGRTVSVVLEDANKNKSDPFVLTQGGENKVPFTKFSNRFGFNPEKVAKIHMTGVGLFTVNSIVSHCAYSLKVYCGMNDAMFDGGIWRIKANIQPFESAKKCFVKAENGGVSGSWFGDCNEAGEFYIEDPDFLDRVSQNNGDLQVDFTVSVFDDDKATETSEATSTCVASSQTYKPVSVSCDLVGDQRDFVQGGGVPALKFNAMNCPAAGCDFDAKLSDGSTYAHGDTKANGIVTWSSAINTTSKIHPGSYSYYVVLYADAQKTSVLKDCYSPEFKVIEAKPARASDCSVLDGKTFSAYVEGSNYEAVTAALVYTDVLGHPVESVKTMKIGANDILRFPLEITADGTYTLTLMLNGEEACSQVYTKGSGATPVVLDCSGINVTGQSNGSSIRISPTVKGCEKSDCSYSIDRGADASGTRYGGGTISFYDVNGSGTENYKLTVSKEGTNPAECNFSVTFAGGSTSATCSVDQSTAYVGESVKLTVSNMKGRQRQVYLEIFQDGSRIFENSNWDSERTYPENGSGSIKMSKEGTSVISAKIDGVEVCSKTVTVKKQDESAYFFSGNSVNKIPPPNTSITLKMPPECGGKVVTINADQPCSVTIDGRSKTVTYYYSQGVGSSFTFSNTGGCSISRIGCY